MVSFSHFLFILLPCSYLFLFFLQKWRRSHAPTSRENPPPSPPKLPVVGNLHQLSEFPHRSLQSLSRRYGPVMLLHFGRVPTLIVSSAEAAREVMKNQDLTFSNRPKLSIPGRLFYNYKDVGFSPYDENWRRVRSICVVQLLSSKRVQSYRRVREEETSAMVGKIMQSSTSTAVNLSEVVACLTNDVICRVALGEKYGHAMNFNKIFVEFMELLGIIPMWEYIPWLSWTRRFDGVDERVTKVAKAIDEFLEKVIQEHRNRNRYGDGDGDGDGEERERDFVDILLKFQRENENSSSPVEDDAVKAIILDIFSAGTDTMSTTLEWAMAELIRNPRTMKILQNEVSEAVGSKGKVEEEDLEKMPYLKAVMKESLRLHPPIPLLVPRESTQDAKVLGYDVASGTRVFVNAWAIAMDPTVWENPEKFYPERFLDTSIDYRGLHFEFIPFGSGRRGCPGPSFAAPVSELAMVKLVHMFDFALPNGAKVEEMDMSEASGLTIRKKLPLLLLATPRAC